MQAVLKAKLQMHRGEFGIQRIVHLSRAKGVNASLEDVASLHAGPIAQSNDKRISAPQWLRQTRTALSATGLRPAKSLENSSTAGCMARVCG
jgi:hypothetical protein